MSCTYFHQYQKAEPQAPSVVSETRSGSSTSLMSPYMSSEQLA